MKESMKAETWHKSRVAFPILLAFLAASLALAPEGLTLTLNVTGPAGESVGGFRWLLEEDNTYHPQPGVFDPYTLAATFHRSYMPVVAKGDDTNSVSIQVDPNKHYFISVLPDSGYTIGGAAVAPGQDLVSVTCNPLPLPTAQITVFVFQDNNPINNAPDLPAENGLEGFSILLFDAGGRYGVAGGQMMQDAFGNPLGTTYDADGTPASMGTGTILTDANGMAVIKNLAPGKYGVQAVPPAGQNWIQTSTIEGTKTIDAWVKPNEPPFFQEFGPPGWHVFIGFVQPFADPTALTGSTTITGRITNLHLSRPPNYDFFNGVPFGHTTPWVGLNLGAAGVGGGIYAQRCNPDGTFEIPNVPPGTYQLVVWDDNLDLIFAFLGVTVAPGQGELALGDVPVFNWFTRLENHVFFDLDGDGFRDEGEPGIPEVPVNLRWRDGSLYQSAPTDLTGFVPFDEVFPFFHWQIAEVDFGRLKATGATITVDAGGPIDPNDPWSFGGILTPQPQSENGGAPYRTEQGTVLLEAFQGFIGQTSVIQWGKSTYGPGENGGISGVVYYAVTRAEDDPRYAAWEPWEPGIPRVQVNLYADGDVDNPPWGWADGGPIGAEDIDYDNDGIFDDQDEIIDDVNGDGGPTQADVDNYPFGWRDGGLKGDEDIDRNGNGSFDLGDALQYVTTDSWDDSVPTGCQGDPFLVHGVPTDCYDGLRNFNQVRPGVFDGGYAFNNLVSGTYIVEAVPPRASNAPLASPYEIVKEEDKNVDFGDEYTPSPLLLPPVCVGEARTVPAELSLFPGVEAAFAGQSRPLCDRKQIDLNDGLNAAVDFFMFTEVPVAAHLVGFILDDLSNEFDPNSPQFGEKYAPPWLPVSIQDWTGREIARVYSDEWGKYNALVPSTFTADRPAPSGMAPNMLTLCMNHPGPIPDPNNPGQMIIDPQFNRQYSQFCYTFQFMPGTTTYLDTPVVPVAAFAGPDQFPLDCEFPDGTPQIYSVNGENGPYVPAPGASIAIVSLGTQVEVLNPAYDGPNGIEPQRITRDYGFGPSGTVTIGGVPLENVAWSPDMITGTVGPGTTTGQLEITRSDSGKSTVVGVTVTVGGPAPIAVPPGGSIQAAIDNPATQAGDLILVPPGTYDELVILWKPVRLQGWGAGSTTINAVKTPTEKLQLWREKVTALVSSGAVDLLPGQALAPGVGVEPGLFVTEEGPGIMVLARNGDFTADPNARIDGFTVTGADNGGAILVNGYASHLEISNNRLVSNQGFYGGGIRVGHPFLASEGPQGLEYQSGYNDHVKIHHNHVTQNGGLGGAGGGVSLCTGSDFYELTDNFVCGNFNTGDGGGIGHLGRSDGGLIARNTIVFNQSFNQGQTVSGGGIFVGGGAPLAPGGLSQGSGSVTILSNLIQGNLAGAGDGGGIRLSQINGADVAASPNRPQDWYSVRIFNNIIVNNVAGLAGGGISFQDAANVELIHNTIAHNDSTATAGEAFTPGSPNFSSAQPAGIVSRAHSTALAGVLPIRDGRFFSRFSNPRMFNDILWQNRSFSFMVDASQTPPFYGLIPDVNAGEPAVFSDLAVLGATGSLDPRFCILTDATGYHSSNLSADPAFLAEYFNGARNYVQQPEFTAGIQTMPAFDEGGNFIDVRFGPLTLNNPATGEPLGNYHIDTPSPALNRGNTNIVTQFAELSRDFDQDPRPEGVRPDIGADEFASGTGTTDTVTITLLTYRPRDGRLRVRATSSAQGDPAIRPTLTATANYGGSTVTLGALIWRNGPQEYRFDFPGVSPVPSSVTVTSSLGGSDTEAIPFP